MNIRESLTHYADDGELKIIYCDGDGLILHVTLPSQGNAAFEIRTTAVIHLDMSPEVTLGSIEFGGLKLLPAGYMDSRNFDYGGVPANYKVLRITDNDGKVHFVVYYGAEEIEPRVVG